MDNKTPKKNKLYKSFGYAFEGIGNTILHERNMQIHCMVTILVIIFGFILKISMIEWYVCLVLFALVMSLELVNTSMEAVVDLVTEERKPLAKKAKDAAAGAVLMSAIIAAILGGIIFFPKLWLFILNI
ncbi:MAG: diacylglycerol kinase family protein [Lachnospiraceae bacterium]|nr:diacylglycerol kinase family protein [Lachnospiraceae bacterium]